MLSKTISVYSNDPNVPLLELRVSGMVERVVTITPRFVKLQGRAGDRIAAEVTIVPEKKYAFHLVGPMEGEKRNFRFRVSESGKGTSVRYRVVIENLKKGEGRYYELLSLRTNSRHRPEIRIPVYARISP